MGPRNASAYLLGLKRNSVVMKTLDFDKQNAREKILELMQIVHRRSDGSTQIMAVTKGFPKEAAIVAYETGITLLGENYAQELIAKHLSLIHISEPTRPY